MDSRAMQNGSTPASQVRHRKRSAEDVGTANGDHLLVNDQNKYRSMLIRAYSSLWMLGRFALIIYMGHLFITAMIMMNLTLDEQQALFTRLVNGKS